MKWGTYYQRLLDSLGEPFELNVDLQAAGWGPLEICALNFEDMYEAEYRLRRLISGQCWQHAFSCCAAQILANFEAKQEVKPSFERADALTLLRGMSGWKLLSSREVSTLNSLALQYLLWRVKTREYYYLEHFYPRLKAVEIRSDQRIPLIAPEVAVSHNLDHRLQTSPRKDLPPTPRLKMGATLDILLLCQSVEIKINHEVMNATEWYLCSCVGPFGDRMSFLASAYCRTPTVACPTVPEP